MTLLLLLLLLCVSITDTDVGYISRVRPTRVIKKDRVRGVDQFVFKK